MSAAYMVIIDDQDETYNPYKDKQALIEGISEWVENGYDLSDITVYRVRPCIVSRSDYGLLVVEESAE